MDKMALIPAEQRSAMQRQVFFFSIFCIEYYFPFLRIASLLIVFAESMSVFVVLLIKNGKKGEDAQISDRTEGCISPLCLIQDICNWLRKL